jgi:hypothetical protein
MTRMLRHNLMFICLVGAISLSPLCLGGKKSTPKESPQDQTHATESLPQAELPSFRPQVEKRTTEFVFSDLEMKVKPECLSPKKQMVFDAVQSQGGLRFEAVTDLLIEDHWAAKKHEFELPYLHSLLDRIADVKDSTDLPSLKVEYENNLERIFSSKTKYNADAKSLVDICSNNRLQCFSGTVLNQVVARKVLGASEFEKQHPVVIYEEGHVLPGFMVLTEQGWQLVGIESTIKGAAKMEPLLVKDLTRPMKIYDANDWILFQLFKDCLENPKATGDQMLSRASKKYSISPLAAELAAKTGSASSQHIAKESDPLAFGVPPDISGDQDRDEADVINPSEKNLPRDIFVPLPEDAIETHSKSFPADPLESHIHSKESLTSSRKKLMEELSKLEGTDDEKAGQLYQGMETIAGDKLASIIGTEREKPVLRAMMDGKIDWFDEGLAKKFGELPIGFRERLGKQLAETARAAAVESREKLTQAAKTSAALATHIEKLSRAHGFNEDSKSKLTEAVNIVSRSAIPASGQPWGQLDSSGAPIDSRSALQKAVYNSLLERLRTLGDLPEESVRALAKSVTENASAQFDAAMSWHHSWFVRVPSQYGQRQPFPYGFGHHPQGYPPYPYPYGGYEQQHPSGQYPYEGKGYPYYK